ncbi:MAG TPA: A24 family peptidase [Pseudolabrys sp.]|nr:A24 family peptidase [Pseudolabrys sp.]
MAENADFVPPSARQPQIVDLHIGRINFGIPLVLTAIIAIVSFASLPPPTALASTVLGALMAVGGIVDARTYILPNAITYGAIASGITAAAASHLAAALVKATTATVRGVAVLLVLLALRWCYSHLRGRHGLGLGDVKLAGAIGVWLPIDYVPLCFAIASVSALMLILIRVRAGQQTKLTTKIPFGTYLCPALWLTFFIASRVGLVG